MKWIRNLFLNYLLRLTKWAVKKYFFDGLTPIYSRENKDRVIAWEWRFYEEK